MSQGMNASANDQAGSVIAGSVQNPNNPGGAWTGRPNEAQQVDYKTMYENLETKLGTQGKELGDYKSFIEGLTPLLEQLDAMPELAQAIIDGKVDRDLAKAALDGKLTIEGAAAVTQAHAEVKKDLGKGVYEKTSSEDIAKLIEEKVNKVKEETQSQIKELEDARIFEASVQDFISRTPDFADYAKDINHWLDTHDITDIEVAYWAVKGQLSDKEAKKLATENAAENAKNLALNAGGGGQRSNFVPAGDELIDSLIAGKGNPNVF